MPNQIVEKLFKASIYNIFGLTLMTKQFYFSLSIFFIVASIFVEDVNAEKFKFKYNVSELDIIQESSEPYLCVSVDELQNNIRGYLRKKNNNIFYHGTKKLKRKYRKYKNLIRKSESRKEKKQYRKKIRKIINSIFKRDLDCSDVKPSPQPNPTSQPIPTPKEPDLGWSIVTNTSNSFLALNEEESLQRIDSMTGEDEDIWIYSYEYDLFKETFTSLGANFYFVPGDWYYSSANGVIRSISTDLTFNSSYFEDYYSEEGLFYLEDSNWYADDNNNDFISLKLPSAKPLFPIAHQGQSLSTYTEFPPEILDSNIYINTAWLSVYPWTPAGEVLESELRVLEEVTPEIVLGGEVYFDNENKENIEAGSFLTQEEYDNKAFWKSYYWNSVSFEKIGNTLYGIGMGENRTSASRGSYYNSIYNSDIVTPDECNGLVEEDECNLDYFSFVTLVVGPNTENLIDSGPVVWPASGYHGGEGFDPTIDLDGGPLSGVRHSTTIKTEDYLYVYFQDHSTGNPREGRGPGIKVARAEINNDETVDQFKTWYLDSQGVEHWEESLPRIDINIGNFNYESLKEAFTVGEQENSFNIDSTEGLSDGNGCINVNSIDICSDFFKFKYPETGSVVFPKGLLTINTNSSYGTFSNPGFTGINKWDDSFFEMKGGKSTSIFGISYASDYIEQSFFPVLGKDSNENFDFLGYYDKSSYFSVAKLEGTDLHIGIEAMGFFNNSTNKYEYAGALRYTKDLIHWSPAHYLESTEADSWKEGYEFAFPNFISDDLSSSNSIKPNAFYVLGSAPSKNYELYSAKFSLDSVDGHFVKE